VQFKTIWQPVPKWTVPVKSLERAKLPKRMDEKKRDRKKEQNAMRKWILNV
jgi:hypothetical protein